MKTAEIVRQLLLSDDDQDRLAKVIGVKQPTVSRYLRGMEPGGAVRDRLFDYARKRGVLPLIDSVDNARLSKARVVQVPLISWVSAGRLGDSGTQLPIEDAPVLTVAGLGAGEWFGLTVVGSSMDRISPPDAVILVNRQDKTLREGKPYVFAVSGETTYKIWYHEPPRLEPFSTDPINKPIFIDKRRSLVVIGRVRRSILDL